MPLVNQSNFASAMERLDQSPRIVEDVEATGLGRWHDDYIVGYALALPSLGKDVFYFPVRHEQGQNLEDHQHDHIRALLSKPDVTYTGWNIKYDIEMGLKEGIPIPKKCEDVMLSAHLLNENEPNFKLKWHAANYIDPSAADAERELKDLLSSMGHGKEGMYKLDPKDVVQYATDDDRSTEKLRHLHIQGLRDWGLGTIWQEVNDYLLATVRMEEWGLMLDQDLTNEYIEEADTETKNAYRILADLAGYEINPRSNPQMQTFLGMKSTAKERLEEIKEGHPGVDATLNYRAWAKANNTYYLPYLKHVDAYGVVHPNLNLHGTVAGRPSADNPNMQAVPRYTRIYKVKDVFKARKGHVLISADYSQAELRLGSLFARERDMMNILNGGGDIHGETAALLGLDRDTAKRINFGVFYGIGPKKLSRVLRIPFKEAQEYLDVYHGRFRNIRPLYRMMQMAAEYYGYIRLWTGRCRRYNTEFSQPHKALSNRVQGGVSEIMRHAIMRLDRELVQTGRMHLCLQVHDQVIAEAPIESVNECCSDMQEIMTDFPQFNACPTKVDISVGKRWGRMEKWAPDKPYRPKRRAA